MEDVQVFNHTKPPRIIWGSILVEVSKGNLKVTKEIPKYEMMSSHTARRSFATNQFKSGAGIASIMAATGHKTQTEFFKYIRMSPDEHSAAH